MRYFLLTFFIICLISCRENQYHKTEHIVLKQYVELNINKYNYNELLLTYLNDSNELVLNEEEVLQKLEDSLVYYHQNGEWFFYEVVDSTSAVVQQKITYRKHDPRVIGCRLHSYFDILMNINDDILVEGEVLGKHESIEDRIKTELLDSSLSPKDLYFSKTLHIPPFKKTNRPHMDLSLNLDFELNRRKSLLQLKYWFKKLNYTITNLRKNKSEIMFQKKFAELSIREKYFILNYFPFKLTISSPIPIPIPPPPPSH